MPTRMHDRFSPRGSLSREQLKAYAEGRSDANAAHQVEMHIEADPLLREAMEGLQMEGSTAMLDRLARARPAPRSAGRTYWLIGGAVVVAIAGVLLWPSKEAGPLAVADSTMEVAKNPASGDVPEHVPLAFAEIDTATEIPEDLLIGHAPTDRHSQASEATVERMLVERIGARPITVDHQTDPPAIDPRSNRMKAQHWIYLHDLKLADPKEMYPTEPLLITEPEHVPARFADSDQFAAARSEQIRIRYTDFMDVALGRFQRNDHKGCLEDLRFLMRQYPNDVNALFYGGLCCYNLGMNGRAKEFLARAESHPVSIFDEEAAWYHALSLERLGDEAAARSEFARIAAQGGFYAKRAKARSSAP